MSEPKKPRKEVITGRMDPDLIARARAIAYWTPGMTFSGLMEEGIRSYLEAWEAEHGKPAPAPDKLREGRPVSLKRL